VSNLIELISTAARRALFEYREQVFIPLLAILVYFLLAPALNLVFRAKNLSQRRHHSNSELLVHHSSRSFSSIRVLCPPASILSTTISHCHPFFLCLSLCLALTGADQFG
jgi:hypothetical protein